MSTDYKKYLKYKKKYLNLVKSGGSVKGATLEVFEYLLNGYMNISSEYATSELSESSSGECGIISVKSRKDTIPDKNRSCDPLNGILEIKKPDEEIILIDTTTDKSNFELYGITSTDLIKFTNLFGAKKENRMKITDFSKIPSLEKLYKKIFLWNI